MQVGDGVTESIGSDRYAYTLVEINRNGKELVIQADEVKRVDENGAFSEAQKYEYIQNEKGKKIVITLRKNGRYKRKGETLNSSYNYHIGQRNAYRDPSF